MLRVSAFILVSALVASLGGASAQAALTITEAMSSSGTNGTGDWFEVTNTGNAPVDITGYRMDDNSFSAPLSVPLLGVTSIAPNQSVLFLELGAIDADTTISAFRTFWGGPVATATIGTYAGSGAGVGLSSGGDAVTLFDGTSTEVTRVTFGAATAGSSFRIANGVFGDISDLGEDGAFQSLSTAPVNIASPSVVPEPASLGLMSLVVCASIRRRRTASAIV